MYLPPSVFMSIAEDVAYNVGAQSVLERSDTTLQADDVALIHTTARGWSVHRYPCNTPLRECHSVDELRTALHAQWSR